MREIVFEKQESTARSFVSLEKDGVGFLIPAVTGAPVPQLCPASC